jgi:hypothetical protein
MKTEADLVPFLDEAGNVISEEIEKEEPTSKEEKSS